MSIEYVNIADNHLCVFNLERKLCNI